MRESRAKIFLPYTLVNHRYNQPSNSQPTSFLCLGQIFKWGSNINNHSSFLNKFIRICLSNKRFKLFILNIKLRIRLFRTPATYIPTHTHKNNTHIMNFCDHLKYIFQPYYFLFFMFSFRKSIWLPYLKF